MFKLLETKKYSKDLEQVRLSLNQNMRLNRYIQALKNGYKLSKSARFKKLHGEWLGYYEISIGWDLRLIYKISKNRLEIVRIGTHTQLFKSL